MRFFITCDSFWEARVEKVLDRLDETGYKHFFEKKDYGNSLNGLAVVLMCQDPTLNLKQRIKYSKKELTIYTDIMLYLNQFIMVSQKERENSIVKKLVEEIRQIVAKFKLQDFDFVRFVKDLETQMAKVRKELP